MRTPILIALLLLSLLISVIAAIDRESEVIEMDIKTADSPACRSPMEPTCSAAFATSKPAATGT